jgi:RimJ/RimL family protein N-acetyltransferase
MGRVPTFRQPIRLEAITLRPFEPADFDAFYAYTRLPEVARYVPWPPNDPERGAIRLGRLIGCRSLEQAGDSLMLAVCEGDTGALVGECMLAWTAGPHRQGEVGYALHPRVHGRGYARAAAQQMLRIGFDEIGLHRIAARCDPRNEPSIRLLQRLGMRQEGLLRQAEFGKDEWLDDVIFAMLADEWPVGPTAG